MSFYSAYAAGQRYSDYLEDDDIETSPSEWEKKLIEADYMMDAQKDRELDREMEVRSDDLRD